MSITGTVGTHPLIPTPDYTSVGGTDPSTSPNAPVGSGTTAPVTHVPGTSSSTSVEMSSILSSIMESLHQFMPDISEDDADVLLAEIQMKMKETVNKTDNAEVSNKSEARNQQIEEQKKKLDDAEKKLQEQIKLERSDNIFDKLKLFFEILGAILATIVAVVVAVVTFGAGTGASAALMAGAIMGVIGAVAGDFMAVNDVVKQSTGLGIAGNLDKLVHPNDPASWAKADMGFMFALLGVAMVGMITAMATGAGEMELENAVDKIATVLMKGVMDQVSVVNKTIQAGTTIVNASLDAASAGISYETTEARAEAKKDNADAKEIEALMKRFDEMIEMAIKRLQANGDRWVKMLDSLTEAIQDKTNHMSHAKLTA